MRLSPRFREALVYAAELHAHQQRKVTGTPYLAHLLRVAGIVLECGCTEDEAVAALLHDAVEDQGGAVVREEIRRRFGEEVVAVVDGLSDTDQTPKPPWRARKQAYVERLKSASASVRLVCAADKLDNVESLLRAYRQGGEAIWRHFRGGRDGTLWYYRAVTNVLKDRELNSLVQELDRRVVELELRIC